MDNKYRTQFNQMKKERREKKRCEKIDPEKAIKDKDFEKFIEGWTTIRIYNTIIQNDKNSSVDKKKVETIVSGNCKVYENELSSEKYKHYLELRAKIYELHNSTINK